MDVDLKELFKDLYLSRYMALVSITLALYDWILVADEEVLLLGTMRIAKGKVLYYCGRFATLIGLLLAVAHIINFRPPLNDRVTVSAIGRATRDHRLITFSCIGFLWMSSLLQVTSIFTSYWLLTLRLLALYKSHRVVVWLLYFALFATYITSAGLLIQTLRVITTTGAYVPLIHLCVPFDHPASLQGVFEVPLVFEVLIFGLMIWRAWGTYREGKDSGAKTAPLLKIMYRDGVFYFCVMVAVRVWNIYIFASRPLQEMYIGLYIMWALITVLSCRIYLNIVREARRNNMPGIQQTATSWTPHVPTHPPSQGYKKDPGRNAVFHGDTYQNGEETHLDSYSMQDRTLVWSQKDVVLDIRR
ncbi:hypothetical protein M408DRAFT_30443 [Serendipita vermifera MAFF 305830]|uniref:DUF6533 domain-containing protein n=1 Tax=Serendipita vermifera MAFF 305830 TaxID=933852 RepID=A0A0C3AJT3_SERVB|nr:hypothetical protein M408DRAFT_30443 [Serendipita vermifera MAFF 305830]